MYIMTAYKFLDRDTYFKRTDKVKLYSGKHAQWTGDFELSNPIKKAHQTIAAKAWKYPRTAASDVYSVHVIQERAFRVLQSQTPQIQR